MGRQKNTLTVDQQKMLAGVLSTDNSSKFCDNICEQILSEHSNRLELLRITCPDKAVQEWIDEFALKVHLDDIQQRVHRNSIRDGNFCLMVEYDYSREKIVIHREKWWDGLTGVFIGYDIYGEMLYAVKQWQTPEGIRRTVWYDGVIERYISSGGSTWFPFLIPADVNLPGMGGFQAGKQVGAGTAISIPNVTSDGQPLHIPFIHFANPGDEFENYGESIYDGGVTENQDQVNDCRWDICSAARETGYQRTWSRGYKLKVDRYGKTIAPRSGPGVHYHADQEGAEWGVLAAGSIDQLVTTYQTVVEAMCRMTNTPYNAITGNWPSGEAVYKLEQPIRGATKARQKRFAPKWVEVMHRCIEIANAIDKEGLDETALLTAEYADAGDRDPLSIAMADLSMWQSASAAVAAGVPIVTFLKWQGFTIDQLDGLAEDIAAYMKSLMSDIPNPTPPKPGGSTTTGTIPNGNSKAGGSTPGAPATAIRPKPSTLSTAQRQR